MAIISFCFKPFFIYVVSCVFVCWLGGLVDGVNPVPSGGVVNSSVHVTNNVNGTLSTASFHSLAFMCSICLCYWDWVVVTTTLRYSWYILVQCEGSGFSAHWSIIRNGQVQFFVEWSGKGVEIGPYVYVVLTFIWAGFCSFLSNMHLVMLVARWSILCCSAVCLSMWFPEYNTSFFAYRVTQLRTHSPNMDHALDCFLGQKVKS